MAAADYIIVQALTHNRATMIDTKGLTEEVNKYTEKGYVVSGGMTIQTTNFGYALFQSMTRPPGQGGGGTKRRRIRKNVQ